MSFTDGPPGYTHSSRAVHPVLWSPPPPKLTHHSLHVRTPHTLSNTLKHVPPTSSFSTTSHAVAHSSSSILPMRQEVVTFFFLYSLLSFFLSFCLFIIVLFGELLPAPRPAPVFSFLSDCMSCFPFYLDDGEQNGFDKQNLHFFFLLHALPFF